MSSKYWLWHKGNISSLNSSICAVHHPKTFPSERCPSTLLRLFGLYSRWKGTIISRMLRLSLKQVTKFL